MSNDLISRQAVIDELKEAENHAFNGFYKGLVKAHKIIAKQPSAQPEWNNHTVACLLAEIFDDTCACNYNGIDEWLSEKCEVIDSCPDPVGVACWEQFLKHRKKEEDKANGNT